MTLLRVYMLSFLQSNMAIAGYQLVVQWSDAATEQKHWSSQHFMKLAPAMTALCETTNVITSTPLVIKQTQPQPKVHW
jgi:quinol monooxygenase YgiN